MAKYSESEIKIQKDPSTLIERLSFGVKVRLREF